MIVAIADDLSPKLRPRYRVAIDQRIYLSSGDERQAIVPDMTVTQQSPAVSPTVATLTPPTTKPIAISLELPEEIRGSYLEVREAATGRVVTIVELLSPKNKRNGEGRMAYNRKHQLVLASKSPYPIIFWSHGAIGSPMPTSIHSHCGKQCLRFCCH
jgi:Protein of unknown function (DUF4058)